MATSQRPTLTDVARLAGVSRQIAGSVLNGSRGSNSRASEETILRIRKVSEELNYKPNLAAMLLRGRRAHLYGLLVASAGDPLRAMLVQNIDLEAAKHNCQTLIGNTVPVEKGVKGRFEEQIEDFSRRGTDGILCLVHSWVHENRKGLLASHPNTVFYENPDLPKASYVAPDRAAAVRMSMQYLLEHGHRRIALATLSRSLPHHVERVRGYHDESKSMGTSIDRKLIFVAEERGLSFDDTGSDTSLDMPPQLTDRIIDDLVRDARADAIICHDDFLAADLIRRLRARNLSVPKDVAVIGYLNHNLCGFTDPPITTVDPDYESAAKELVCILESMISDPENHHPPRTVKVKPKLIAGASA